MAGAVNDHRHSITITFPERLVLEWPAKRGEERFDVELDELNDPKVTVSPCVCGRTFELVMTNMEEIHIRERGGSG